MKKTLLTTAAVAIPLFVFSGCATTMPGIPGMAKSTQSKSNNSMPQWYLNPQTSNSMYYYGVGQGDTKEEAKSQALSQIASEISVSVSSSMEVQKKNSTTAGYSKETEQNIKTSVEKIKFTSAKIEKSDFFNGKFYSLVSIDKQSFFQSQKAMMEKEYKELTALWNLIKSEGAFELLKNYNTLQQKRDLVYLKLPILKAIDSNFNQKSYEDKINDIINKATDLKANIYIIVLSSKENGRYAEVVKNHVSSNGFKVTNSLSGINPTNIIKMELSKTSKQLFKKTTNPKLKNAKFALVEITLKAKNSANKIIAQNSLKVTNISNASYQDAVSKTAKFDKALEKKGLLNLLLGK